MISSELAVPLLLILNTVCALVYLLVRRPRDPSLRTWISALIILLCPVVAPVLFGISSLVFRLFLSRREIDLKEVSFSHEKKQFIFAPEDDERELVPIEESLLVATHAERRKAFLKSIRLNVDKNVQLYSLALENDDPETSHYSASIVMESIAGYQQGLQEFSIAYEKKPDDPQLTMEYIESVRGYLASKIPSGIELKRYEELYAFLSEGMLQKHPETLSAANFSDSVSILLHMQDYPRAEKWAKEGVRRFPDDELPHLSLLKVYYTMGNSEAFLAALSVLRASYIELSRSGAALLRYFTTVGEAAAPVAK